MPMIDVYAAIGTFAEKQKLAQDLANAVMKWEKVPPIKAPAIIGRNVSFVGCENRLIFHPFPINAVRLTEHSGNSRDPEKVSQG